MTRMLMTAMAALILGCGTSSAQMGTSAPSPLGITSPLGIGPAAAVPPVGIPLGSTEVGSLGLSPTTSGISPVGPAPNDPATCRAITSPAGNLSGTSPSTATGPSMLFDGGGMAGTASGTCAPIIAPTTSASPETMTAPVGRIGIPMGSTELGAGGLSPIPTIPTPNPTAPSMTPPTLAPGVPCATTGTTSTGGAPTGSC